MQGKILEENNYDNTKQTLLTTSNLVTGTYLIIIQSDRSIENQLFIKK